MPRLNRAVLEQIVALSAEAVLVADVRRVDCPVIYANQAFERLVEIVPGSAEGRRWCFFLAPDSAAAVDAVTQRVAAGSACQSTLTGRAGLDGQLEINATPLTGRHGSVRYMLVRVTSGDGSAARGEVVGHRPHQQVGDAHEASARPGRRDPDTGLLRYGYFLELCRRDLALCSRERRAVAVLVFTIQEFDVYRRTFGDKGAQSCLRMVGGRISGALRRAGDLCARLDEASFVALITGHSAPQAARFAEHIAGQVRRLALHHPRASGERYVTCATRLHVKVPQADDQPEDLVRAAQGSRAQLAAASSPAA